MRIGRRSEKGLVIGLLTLAAVVAGGVCRADVAPDSLELQRPEGLKVWRIYDGSASDFRVFMTWKDVPDSCGTYIHQPDTSGWASIHFSSETSVPSSEGVYTGDIDRTIAFRALDTGMVGVDPTIRIEYAVRGEEYLNGQINVGSSQYAVGQAVKLMLRNSDPNSPDYQRTYDYGIRLRFSSGWVDRQGGFVLGVEDFEGYHVWRGIEPDGSDLEIIGELSKEEAHFGSRTGGSVVDSVYFYSVIPTLRDSLTWFSPFGSVDCLGTRIHHRDITLEDDGLFWFDCNAFNGFTYYYTVTTFDRGYLVRSGRQGLVKTDNCLHYQDIPYKCAEDLVSLSIEVEAQSDVNRVYAVPNPYRTGGSRLTQENYHNFPDDKIRFVNVPPRAVMKIFTVAGDLVWEGEHDGMDGNVEWDVRNLGGNDVGSGVYIFRVEADNGDVVYGRLVIIR